jgi:hypothetical protein
VELRQPDLMYVRDGYVRLGAMITRALGKPKYVRMYVGERHLELVPCPNDKASRRHGRYMMNYFLNGTGWFRPGAQFQRLVIPNGEYVATITDNKVYFGRSPEDE